MSSEINEFMRNRYYDGKMLTADDFSEEQNYFIGVRRFINNLSYCGGVICGLRAEKVSESVCAVTVNPGAAVDYKGAEIIVPDKVVVEVDEEIISGNIDSAYLCLEYDEEEAETTFSPLSTDDTRQNNKLKEKYRFVWQYDTIDIPGELALRDKLNGTDLYWNRSILYNGAQCVITQSVPRYVKPGSLFEIRVELIRLVDGGDISFSYIMSSPNIGGGMTDKNIKVNFTERDRVISGKYVLPFPAFVSLKMAAAEKLTISTETFSVKYNDVTVARRPVTNSWDITRSDADIREYLRNRYLDRDAGEMLQDLRSNKLYLAKVNFERLGGRCAIKSLINQPFGQCLDGWRLDGILNGVMPSMEMITRVVMLKPDMVEGTVSVAINYKPRTYAQVRTALIARLSEAGKLPPWSERRKLIDMLHECERRSDKANVTEPEFLSLFSDTCDFESTAIIHGLGPGSVTVTYALSPGALPIDPLSVELRAVIDESKGEFIIKGKMLKRVEASSLTLTWSACRTTNET